jgi:PDZ domain-containing protein
MAVTAASLPGPSVPSGFARFRRELKLRHWGALHRRLAAQPVFAACSRQEIRAIARWGDEVSVDAGAELWHEDTIGYHFVVVETGELSLSRKHRRPRTLGPGDYVGDTTILGFAPQSSTLTAKTACNVFVLGRAALLSLVHATGVRTGLFGDVDEDEVRERIRKMRAEGRAEWLRRYPAGTEPPTVTLPNSIHFYARTPLATPPRWSVRSDRVTKPMATSPLPSRRMRVLVAAAVSVAVLISVVAVATTTRPQVALVTPGKPIDIADDLTINGAQTYPIHGHYVLTPVSIRRPTYAHWLLARFGHETTTKLAPDQAAASQASRDAYDDAKRKAVRAAAAVLSMDPAKLDVAMRPLDLGGSSASLTYALAVADMLDPADLARGRTIAATGQLDADGRVGAVRFVAEKARAARAAGATLFLVPPGLTPPGASMKVVEVATLADAIAALRAMNG